MQVLWSRAQARASCRCRSCLHAAVARRTTTAATKRRLRVSDVFTACYSTILATAALADAKVKEDRRKEWDQLIAETKAEIPMNEPDFIKSEYLPPTSDSPGRGSYIIRKISGAADESLSKTDRARGGIGWAIPPRIEETSLENKLMILDSRLKEISPPSETLPEQEVLVSTSSNPEPDHEWMGTPDAELLAREPRTKQHLDKMEEMIANLVDRLLHQTDIHSVQSSAALARDDILRQMNGIAQRIDMLKKGFTRVPAYSWDDVESVEEQRLALHRSLTALCSKTTSTKSSIDLMLAKVCYNLLICTAPPSISTYDILLQEFNRLRQPELAQIVVDSFLKESKFKPSTGTARLILDHYRIKKDPNGFSATIKRMGGHLKGMHVKRRHASSLWVPAIREWALTNKVILRDAQLYQKMPRGTGIFDSLIRGSLEMQGVRSAIRHIRAALREGYGVTSQTLCTIIRACVTRLDFQAGISLLRAVLSWTESTDFSTAIFSKEVRYYMHELLALCGISSSSGVQQVLPFSISKDMLQKMLQHMQIESIAESVEQFAERISSLEKVLCVNGTQSSTSLPQNGSASSDHDRVTRAIELLKGQYREEDIMRAKRKRKNAAARRWARIQLLEKMLATHAEQITASQAQLLRIIFARLSTERKHRYFKSITLSEKTGQVVSMSDRFELLLRLARTPAKTDLELLRNSKRIELQPDFHLNRTSKKNPSPPDTAKARHLVPLFPIISVSKADIRAVAV